MKILSGIVGGFVVGMFANFIFALPFALDMERAEPVGLSAFLIFWALTIAVAFFSKSVAKVWRYVFLACSIFSFLMPISALIFSGKNVRAVAEAGSTGEVAANIFAGGAFSATLVIVGFFLGVVFLIIGLLTGREKP